MNTATVDTTYNGWKNYETWNINLWVSNDHGLNDYFEDRAQYWLEYYEGDSAPAQHDCADEMESYITDLKDETTKEAGMFTDLLTHALQQVDWDEIAAVYIEIAEYEEA